MDNLESGMTIFVSYSHNDSDIVEKIVTELIKMDRYIFIDKWEIGVGDSFLDKIQSAMNIAGAILVVLSNSSIQSEWCKTELKAALTKQLNEKTHILPVLIEDCEIPLFLRDRKYADFRSSFDKGIEELIVATAKYSNLYQRRLFLENHEFDYSMDWGIIDGLLNLRYTFVDQKPNLRMTFLTEITVIANNKITEEYSQALKKNRESKYINKISGLFISLFIDSKFKLKLSNNHPVKEAYALHHDDSKESYKFSIQSRRLGDDNGMVQLLDISSYFYVLDSLFQKKA